MLARCNSKSTLNSIQSKVESHGETVKLASYATPPLSPAADRVSSFGPAWELSGRDLQGGMEGEDPHRRQYEQHNHPQGFLSNVRSQSLASGSGSNVYDVQNLRGAQRPSVSDRFRQPQSMIQQTPTSIELSASGGHPQVLSGYGYGIGQPYPAANLQGNTLQYQPEYIQDPQRQHQYPSYTSHSAHGMPQQVQTQSPYDNLPQFQPRQSAAVELSSQFGVPPYYNPGDSTSASVPASLPQQFGTTNYSQQLPYQPPGSSNRSPLHTSYASGMAGFSPAGPVPAEDQTTQSWEREYEERLRGINYQISNGTLGEAGPSLLEFSRWFLGRVSEFGLTVDVSADNMDIHDQRVNMWTEFNLSWLALLQRQKENTEQTLQLSQSPLESESLLGARFLERMGSELVRLCDNIERYGLVDYEMGVAEEEIINVLTECLDLLPKDDAATALDAAAGTVGQS